MTDLITRLEKLEGPCWECNLKIASMSPDGGGPVYVPKYTSSLDAIAGLIERDLPDAEIDLNIFGIASASVYTGGGQSCESQWRHKVPAIALCIAYCKAKQAEGQT